MAIKEPITAEDIKWLNVVREREMFNRKTRPLPSSIQTRLRGMGLIDLRKGGLVLTAEGNRVLRAEARR